MNKTLSLAIVLVVLTTVFGTVAVVSQQSLRLGANDPQIQLAEDAAAALNHGAKPQDIATASVDIRSSLAPFVVVYDRSFHAVAGSGYLDGQLAPIPRGVLTAADGQSYHFVTWQPEAGTRIAAVSAATDNYYVLSGRSIKEVERRETHIVATTAVGWLSAVIVTIASSYIHTRLTRRAASKVKARA